VALEQGCENWCTSHLFIIPASVQGKWRLPEGVLSLTQKYQIVEGTYTPTTGAPASVKGRLRGDRITLTVGETEYTGTITGNRIEGTPTAEPGARKIVGTRMQ
jgi:hypothetical protein